jgi:predicted AlkP superfamily phosphohydrolase/phosphomutase
MSELGNNPHHGRLLVIGLDAGTLDLVRPWAEAGLLPNLECLIKEGVSGTLQSTIPTISPAAWISMITGKNPGRHGIYDFVQRRPGSYHLHYVQPDLPRLGTVFGRLSQYGRRVGVMGVPVTYPPEPVNGFMISGPWAPDNERCVYPTGMFPFLKERGYEINNSVAYSPETAGEFVKYLDRITDVRASVALELLRREPWDFFMVVFRDTDTVASFFWHDMDPTHPLHDPERAATFGNVILDHYRQLDRIIGLMVEAIDEETSVLVVSDHGSGPLYAEISLNKWLLDLGLLQFKAHTSLRDRYHDTMRQLGLTRSGIIARLGWPFVHRIKRALPDWFEQLIPWPHAQLIEQVDWSRTTAYSFGSIGQIYVNLRGREPEGIVEPGEEYEGLIETIISELGRLVDPRTGRKVKTDVYRREDLYQGPFAELGPDLNVIFDDLTCTTHITLDAVRDELVGPPADWETGFHSLNGMYIAWGPHIREGVIGETAQMVDIAPTMFYLMGELVPHDVDGRVLTELLETDFVDAHPVREDTVVIGETEVSRHPDWTPEEEEKILNHLKDLGYIG